jgi:hypothetical protein
VGQERQAVDEMADNASNMISEIAALSRDQMVERLLGFPGKFRMDFTADYLSRQTDAQLRHILVAACKHNGRR